MARHNAIFGCQFKGKLAPAAIRKAQVEAHPTGQIQEKFLNAVVGRQGATLESFYVHLVMQACSSDQQHHPK